MNKITRTQWLFILILAVIKFALPFLLQNSVYELHRDEYLYYQQGQHLALGFLECPPGIAILAKISSWFGGGFFWIKFWPSFFGAITLVVACFICIEMGGNKFAIFLTGLGVITGAYLRIHYLFQPNILDIFFWTLSLYFLVNFLKTKDSKYIYLLAISIALGWWSKYTIIFIAISIFSSLIITRQKKVFSNKHSYLAALLFLILISANLYWQNHHHWPLIQHMNELKETQLKFISPADFLKDQILMLFPVCFLWIAGLIWTFRNKEWRIMGWLYILVLVFLIFGGGKSYYTLGLYPAFIAIGSVYWERITQNKLWAKYLITLVIIAMTYLFIPLLLPTKEPKKLAEFYQTIPADKIGILKWEDQLNHPLPQDFADMLGWKELTEKTEFFYQSLPDSIKKSTVVYCRNYGQAGALQFYGIDKLFIEKVITDNGSFLQWIPENFKFKNLIFVGRKMPNDDDEVFQHFDNVSIIDSVTNEFSRQKGDKIIYFQNADSIATELAIEKLKELKNKF